MFVRKLLIFVLLFDFCIIKDTPCCQSPLAGSEYCTCNSIVVFQLYIQAYTLLPLCYTCASCIVPAEFWTSEEIYTSSGVLCYLFWIAIVPLLDCYRPTSSGLLYRAYTSSGLLCIHVSTVASSKDEYVHFVRSLHLVLLLETKNQLIKLVLVFLTIIIYLYTLEPFHLTTLSPFTSVVTCLPSDLYVLTLHGQLNTWNLAYSPQHKFSLSA